MHPFYKTCTAFKHYLEQSTHYDRAMSEFTKQSFFFSRFDTKAKFARYIRLLDRPTNHGVEHARTKKRDETIWGRHSR